MNKCGTCKWFDASPDSRNHEIYKVCGYARHRNEDYSNNLGEQKGLGALVEDGSGYYAALIVEEDFGCVKWESK